VTLRLTSLEKSNVTPVLDVHQTADVIGIKPWSCVNAQMQMLSDPLATRRNARNVLISLAPRGCVSERSAVSCTPGTT
jgi:hypothetical protein